MVRRSFSFFFFFRQVPSAARRRKIKRKRKENDWSVILPFEEVALADEQQAIETAAGEGEGVGEAVRGAQAGFEEAVLAEERARGREAQRDGDDRRGGRERLEMRVQRAEKNLGGGGRLGQTEAARVRRVVLEPEGEG